MLTFALRFAVGQQLGGSRSEKDELNVEVDVKDSGMMIVTTVAPEMQWIGGAAHLQFTCGPPTSHGLTPA